MCLKLVQPERAKRRTGECILAGRLTGECQTVPQNFSREHEFHRKMCQKVDKSKANAENTRLSSVSRVNRLRRAYHPQASRANLLTMKHSRPLAHVLKYNEFLYAQVF